MTHIALDLQTLTQLELRLIWEIPQHPIQLQPPHTALLHQQPSDDHQPLLGGVGAFPRVGPGDFRLVWHRLSYCEDVVDGAEVVGGVPVDGLSAVCQPSTASQCIGLT